MNHAAHDAFAAAIRREAGVKATSPAASVRPEVKSVGPALRPDDFLLGELDTGGQCGIDLARLFEGRLLIQGASGAGKSWTLRRLLEQTTGKVQQIVVDPEGEFRTIADRFGHVVLDAGTLDIASLAQAAARAREHRISLILDLSDLDRERQMQAITAFFVALIDAPREHWHPVLVAVDEVHLFAPFGGQSSVAPSIRKGAIDAVTDLMSRGRKRGLCGVLATQRLARLSKSVVSEVQNFLIGLNTLDLDIRRAAETIGWDARRAFDRMPMLEPGHFVAVGPSFSRSPAVAHVGAVQTIHRGEAPKVVATAIMDRADAERLLDIAALTQESAADAEVLAARALPEGLRAVRAFVREPAFSAAGLVWDALVPLMPDGARVHELGPYVGRSPEDTMASLDLLDRYGLVQFLGEGQERIVRLARGALP